MELWQSVIRRDDVVLDVGANVGAFTIPLAEMVGDAGVVHAFEPDPRNFQTIAAQTVLNSKLNVRLHQAAVGSVDGHFPMAQYATHRQLINFGDRSLLLKRMMFDNEEQVNSRVMTIDSMQLDRCDFVKLDIQGMEMAALVGMKATLERLHPFVFLENDTGDAETFLFLRDLGYICRWHVSRLFRPHNFNNATKDVFGGSVSKNMICVAPTINMRHSVLFPEEHMPRVELDDSGAVVHSGPVLV